MLLLNPQTILKLQDEFRISMRRLLIDLCRELHADHADLTREFGVQTSFLDCLHSHFRIPACSTWKVVGWIETLNDLVYLLDVLKQWKTERERPEFAAQFFDECRDKFFEHGYLDDLFPMGQLDIPGLEKRLVMLCQRLSQEVMQEALWFDPVVFVKWLRQHKVKRGDVPGVLTQNFERGELSGTIPVGCDGAWCQAPKAVQPALRQSGGRVVFHGESTGISVKVGKLISPIWSGWTDQGTWQWKHHPPMSAATKGREPVTVGPTLVYGKKNRQPKAVKPTGQRQVERITGAWQTVQLAWPEGHQLLELLTSRIIPLRATGVVSFSYRHRPGLSFINCFDRGNLDLIDDLIHENSHHHLNLLLRKHVMYYGDQNQQIFYSPWRRRLRPLRGILHATFTFTMGALLFQQLVSWGTGHGGAVRWKKAGLTTRDLQRAHFRCLEELTSVRYSLHDLQYADRHLGWLTGSGRRLVGQLTEAIAHVERTSEPFKRAVDGSSFAPALRKHIKELEQARQTYGPMRLRRA